MIGVAFLVAFVGAVPLAWGIIRAVTASLLFGRTSSKFLTLTPDAGVISFKPVMTLGSFAERANP